MVGYPPLSLLWRSGMVFTVCGLPRRGGVLQSVLCREGPDDRGKKKQNTDGEGANERMASKSAWLKEVEWQLYNYPVHKQLLLQYQRRCADIAPSVSQLDRPKGRRGHGYGSITEGEALRMAKIAERMGNLAWFVEAVDDILPLLSPAERHILEQRYFAAAPRPVWQIANDIYISRSEYYRHRDHLLWKFGRRFGLF